MIGPATAGKWSTNKNDLTGIARCGSVFVVLIHFFTPIDGFRTSNFPFISKLLHIGWNQSGWIASRAKKLEIIERGIVIFSSLLQDMKTSIESECLQKKAEHGMCQINGQS
jgi:hypothetical protein